jgi:hypothetical protein
MASRSICESIGSIAARFSHVCGLQMTTGNSAIAIAEASGFVNIVDVPCRVVAGRLRNDFRLRFNCLDHPCGGRGVFVF